MLKECFVSSKQGLSISSAGQRESQTILIWVLLKNMEST